MTALRTTLLALSLAACNFPFRSLPEEPSVADVYARLGTDSGERGLVIGTWAPEGDWSYGVYGSVRLESLVVTGPDGATLQPGEPRLTPTSDWGGHVFVPLPTLPPGVTRVRVAGRFVGLDDEGQIVLTRDFDVEGIVRE